MESHHQKKEHKERGAVGGNIAPRLGRTGIILCGIIFLLVLGVSSYAFASNFIGPSGAGGIGSGATAADQNFSIGIGTSTTGIFPARITLQASSSPAYAFDVFNPSGSLVFSVDDNGNISTTGSLTATAISGNGTWTGSITAGNVTAGQFGANFGGGVYTFPGNVGIGTTAPATALDVAGKIIAAEGSGTSGGYSFEGDGGYDTGMFSASDGDLHLYSNGQNALGISGTSVTVPGTLTVNGSPLQPQYVTWIDLTGYDQGTWYPVTIPVPTGRRDHLRIEDALNEGGTPPSWATHGAGFSVLLDWAVNSNGWGTIAIEREIYAHTYSWTNGIDPIGGLSQMSNANLEVVWLRGGGRYLFESDDPSAVPTPHASSYTNGQQTVSPSTTQVNNPLSQGAGYFGVGGLQFSDGTVQTTAASGSAVVTAGNVSAGTFGSSTGGGNYVFPGNVTAGGGVYAAGASGFYSTTYVVGARNPIWRFGNADGYGISYFQGSAGIGGLDTIGFHFGTATAAASLLQVNQNGTVTIQGNVGIGTTNPEANLMIGNGNGGGIRIGAVGDIGNSSVAVGAQTDQYNIDFSGYRDVTPDQIGARISEVRFNNYSANSALVQNAGLAFFTNPSGGNGGATDLAERMFIAPGGNVGIGTTAPAAKLDVAGGINLTANGSNDAPLEVGYDSGGYYAVYAP